MSAEAPPAWAAQLLASNAAMVAKMDKLDELQKTFGIVETKLNLVDDLVKRMDALEAKHAASSAASVASAWSTGPPASLGGGSVSTGSPFKLQRSADNRQHDPRAARAASVPAAPNNDPCIVWLSGAGRPLLAKQWEEIAKRVLHEHVSAELADQTTIRGLNMQDRCKLVFPSDVDSRNFQNSFLGTPSTWTDPRSTKVQKLRIRKDLSVAERDFGRFMGSIWALVDTALRAKHDNDFPPNARLGTSGGQVIMYDNKGGTPDPYVLLFCKTDRERDLGRLRPEAWYDNCHTWGLDRSCMDDIISKASQIARGRSF